jgi:hypothetical protein
MTEMQAIASTAEVLSIKKPKAEKKIAAINFLGVCIEKEN